MTLDQEIRGQFPQLQESVDGRRLVYLDSAATALKPLAVIETSTRVLARETANVHRGAYRVSDTATGHYEAVREKLRQFVGAERSEEIVFTHGTTEGLNLLAHSLGQARLKPGDEILVSQMEHHSNIVPWQMAAQIHGAKVRFIPLREDGTLDFEAYQTMLSKKVKIVSLVHLSNALGTINEVAKFFKLAHQINAICVLDAAQSSVGMPLKVRDLHCDFLVFSGHKLFAPTGVGALYGQWDKLNELPPYQGGGSMISVVTEEGSEYLPPPHRFEAGTPAIAQVIALGAALDFINEIGFQKIQQHEAEIYRLAESRLKQIPGLRILGGGGPRSHALSFLLDGAHPSDVGSILDQQGIAVRAGHHCCQPLMRRFGIAGTVRASFSVYTSAQDIEDLAIGLLKAKELLA
jgi:cysteine desulfurase/selenocysteine lyase